MAANLYLVSVRGLGEEEFLLFPWWWQTSAYISAGSWAGWVLRSLPRDRLLWPFTGCKLWTGGREWGLYCPSLRSRRLPLHLLSPHPSSWPLPLSHLLQAFASQIWVWEVSGAHVWTTSRVSQVSRRASSLSPGLPAEACGKELMSDCELKECPGISGFWTVTQAHTCPLEF